MKRNKIEKKNSGKKKQKNHTGKHCSNKQCFKEKNYNSKFSTSPILKKIKLTKIILKKNTKKIKRRRQFWKKSKKKKKKKMRNKTCEES